MPTVLFILTGMKLITAALGMQLYLRKKGSSPACQLLFGAVYMMSGWVTVFLEQEQFLSFYAFLPFVLAGVEDLYQKKDGRLFFAGMTAVLLCNYYLAWPLCVYVLLLWICRWNSPEEGYDHHLFWKQTFRAIGLVVLAAVCCGFLLVPSLAAMAQSPRISHELIHYSGWSLHNVLAILMDFLIPVIRAGSGESLLYHDYWYYFYQLGMYAGTLALLLVPQQLAAAAGKKKRSQTIFLLVILATLVSPQIGKFFHLTYSMRYTFIVLLALIELASEAFDQPLASRKRLLITLAALEAGAVLLGFVIPWLLQYPRDTEYPEQKLLLAAMGFLALDAILLLKDNRHLQKQLLTCSGIAEVLLCGNVALNQQSGSRSAAEYLVYDEEIRQIYEQLQERTPTFFRVDLQTGYNASTEELSNAGMYYGIPSLSGYQSVYESSLHDYLEWIGLYPDVSWNFRIAQTDQFRLPDARYSICSPKYAYAREDQNEPLLTTEHFLVYENEEAQGMAFTATALTPASTLEQLAEEPEIHAAEITELLNDTVVVDDELIESYSELLTEETICYDPVSWDSDSMQFSIHAETDELVLFSIPASAGWSVQDNGKAVSWVTGDGGFILLQLSAGDHELQFQYEVPYLKAGLICSGAGILLAVCIVRKKKEPKK